MNIFFLIVFILSFYDTFMKSSNGNLIKIYIKNLHPKFLQKYLVLSAIEESTISDTYISEKYLILIEEAKVMIN